MLSSPQQRHQTRSQREHRNQACEINTLKQLRDSRDLLGWQWSPTYPLLSLAFKSWGALRFSKLLGGVQLIHGGLQLPGMLFLVAPCADGSAVPAFFPTPNCFHGAWPSIPGASLKVCVYFTVWDWPATLFLQAYVQFWKETRLGETHFWQLL